MERDEIYPQEIVDLDDLTGVPKRQLLTKIGVPNIKVDFFGDNVDPDLIFMGERRFKLMVYAINEWVERRVVDERSQGFYRVYRWTTLEPDLTSFPETDPTKLIQEISSCG